MTFDEEIATLQQFLRFGETKSIVELMALQDKEGQAVLVPSTCTNSDIRTFIERNTPHISTNLSTSKTDKLSTNRRHHFENLINSMAFMLPFQLLGSVSAPLQLLGSVPAPIPLQQPQQHLQPCCSLFEQQSKKQDDKEPSDLVKSNSLLHPPESSLDSFLGSGCVLLPSDLDQIGSKPIDSLSTTTKKEVEEFSPSDSCSERPSTPCSPSMSSEVTQLSPEGKQSSLDRNTSSNGGITGGSGAVGSLKKGRVFCTACEKTFYDKGTLKIHYNAVHLKIKHKCTIEGCNMVFSSLRSRNRHSANPNPRLHMPMNRNNRDKDLRSSLSADETPQLEKRPDYRSPLTVSTTEGHKSVPGYMVSHVDNIPKIHCDLPPSVGQSGVLFPNLKTVQPVLPFYRSLVTPAEIANTPGTLPSLPLLSSSVPVKPIVAPEPVLTDPLPKKKSRKSSMPIKIEKEEIEQNEQMDKDRSSENEPTLHGIDKERCDGCRTDRYTCTIQARKLNEVREYITRQEKERESEQRLFDHTSGQDLVKTEDKDDVPCQAETMVISYVTPSLENKQMDNRCKSSLLYQVSKGNEERKDTEDAHSQHSANKISELRPDKGKHILINGDTQQHLDDERVGLTTEEDDCNDSSLSHLDPNNDLPHHCEICKKTFKNLYSVKMHYQNVHLREMHFCTVDGCNAGFPSRRSRDR